MGSKATSITHRNIMDEEERCPMPTCAIKVIGVGGGGGNAVNNMMQAGLTGVTFIAANTDSRALECSLANHKLLLGQKVTGGFGADGNTQIGYDAARESADLIQEAINDADIIFIIAGMGGGTGMGNRRRYVRNRIQLDHGCIQLKKFSHFS